MIAMLYCSAGYDSSTCSSFNKIESNSQRAELAKNYMSVKLNAETAAGFPSIVGELTTSYYSDAIGLPITLSVDALRQLNTTFDFTMGAYEKACKLNEDGECQW